MPQLDLVQYYSPFSYIAKGNTRIVKGFASTTGPENTDRSGEFVKSPFEFDLVTFKNSPQLLVDHDYIKTPEGNSVAAGKVTKAIPSYIKSENPTNPEEWVVHSLTTDEFISTWPKEKSATLAEGSQGLFIVAEVNQPFAIDLVDKGELRTFSWRGYALSEKVGDKVALKHIDPVEISMVHTQCERSSTFMLVDHDDFTNNLEIDFTDCEICSLKFQKNIHTENSVRDYTKQLNLNTYTLLQNEDSFFVEFGDCKVDKSKTFQACSKDGFSVLAAPKIKIKEVPIVGQIPKTPIKEETMPEDSNKVTIMVGDVETFQKFAPNVKLEHLKEVEFEGAPADLYTAIAEPAVAEVEKQDEVVETPVVETPAEVVTEPVAEPAAEPVVKETPEVAPTVEPEVVEKTDMSMMMQMMQMLTERLDMMAEGVMSMQTEMTARSTQLEKQVEAQLEKFQSKKEIEEVLAKQAQKNAEWRAAFGAEVPATDPKPELVEKSNQFTYNPFAIDRSN